MALAKGYITEEDYPLSKMPMSSMFDMIGGTSSGGILAAALVTPSHNDPKKPKFYANDILDLYIRSGPNIFKTQTMNTWLLSYLMTGSIVVSGLIGYFVGVKKYANPKVEETHDIMRAYIKTLKHKIKHPNEDQEENHHTLDFNAFSPRFSTSHL